MPSNTLKQWQVEMASLLRRQQEKGGTVDDTGGINDVIDDTWVSVRYRLYIGILGLFIAIGQGWTFRL